MRRNWSGHGPELGGTDTCREQAACSEQYQPTRNEVRSANIDTRLSGDDTEMCPNIEVSVFVY